MDRLTMWEDNYRGGKWTSGWDVSVNDLCEKLAAYEDTGLMPEEVEPLKKQVKALEEAYDRNAKIHEALTLDYLALKAELERVAPFLATHKACGYSFQDFQGKAEALAAMKEDERE